MNSTFLRLSFSSSSTPSLPRGSAWNDQGDFCMKYLIRRGARTLPYLLLLVIALAFCLLLVIAAARDLKEALLLDSVAGLQ